MFTRPVNKPNFLTSLEQIQYALLSWHVTLIPSRLAYNCWHNVWIFFVYLYFYLRPLTCSPSLLPADGQMDGTADLTLTFLLTQLRITSLLRLAGEVSTNVATCRPDTLWGHLLKAVTANNFPNLSTHPTIYNEHSPYVCKSQQWGWLAPFHSVAHVYED